MTAVWQVVSIRSIKHIAFQTFIHRPVESEPRLTSVQNSVCIAFLFLIRKYVIPYTYLGNFSTESLVVLNILSTAYREGI